MTAKGTLTVRTGPRYGARSCKASNKFKARSTVIDGVKFDSQKEALRYQQLRLEERAGDVRNLEMQVPYQIRSHTMAGGVVDVAKYIADFRYERRQPNGSWLPIVEDVKGGLATVTKDFLLKKKLVEAQYGLTIHLT